MATPSTLYEFYTQKGQSLPSLEERAKLYEQYGLGSASSYIEQNKAGISTPNINLLNKLLSQTTAIKTTTAPEKTTTGSIEKSESAKILKQWGITADMDMLQKLWKESGYKAKYGSDFVVGQSGMESNLKTWLVQNQNTITAKYGSTGGVEALKTKISQVEQEIKTKQEQLQRVAELGYTGTEEIPEAILDMPPSATAADKDWQVWLDKYIAALPDILSKTIGEKELTQEEKDNLKLQNDLMTLQLKELQDKLSSPDQKERDDAKKEAETYYQYTLPTGGAVYSFPQMKAEIETRAAQLEQRAIEDYGFQKENIDYQKQELAKEYQQALEDIEKGELRIGSDYERQQRQALEEKRLYLENAEATISKNLEVLHRSWLGRGGLYTGLRFQAAQQYQSEADRARQFYLGQFEYGQQTATNEYQRAMQDYLTKRSRLGEAYATGQQQLGTQLSQYGVSKTRTTEDIALARLKDIRSLEEIFQEAVGKRISSTLEEKY